MKSVQVGRRFLSPAGISGAAALSTLLLAAQAAGQVPVDENGTRIGSEVSPLEQGVRVENPTLATDALSATELETLVGPIALYPDDLIAVVLPASTYPLEIVQAARFLEAAATDESLQPDEAWDDSVVALLNYPDVLRMMNEDIDWTWKLGEAVVDQQPDVITAIESFRDRAYAAGNLKSDQYQTVSVDDGVIEIEPVDDDVIYVPYYEPARVVAYSPRPVYHYYPDPRPVYYSPYTRRHFGARPFWGVTTAFAVGWATDRLHVYHHSYNGHPYYGHAYYGSYWRRPSINVYNSYYVDRYRYRPYNRYRVGDYWAPRHRAGARPNKRVARNYYAGRRDDRRNGRDDTRIGREYRNERRFSDTINNATRNNATRARPSTDPRLNRRAANRNSNRSINRNGNDRRARPTERQQNRARQNARDANRIRARGDGRYSVAGNNRVQRARSGRENEPVRNARLRGVNNTRARTSTAPRQRANTPRRANNSNVQRQRVAPRTRVRATNRAQTRAARPQVRREAPRVRSAAPQQRVRNAAPRNNVRSAPRTQRAAVSRPAQKRAQPRRANGSSKREQRSTRSNRSRRNR